MNITQLIKKLIKIIQQFFVCRICRWYCSIRPVLPESLQQWLTPLHSLICGLCEETRAVSQQIPTLWQSIINVSIAPFADSGSRRAEVMVTHLKELLAAYPVKSVKFSNLTGLVRVLRGNFYPEQKASSTNDMLDISKRFLKEYRAALHGSEDAYAFREANPAFIGSCVRLCQTDRSGIPVYGATMTFGFHDGYLGIIMNSWYPLPPDANYQERFRLDWAKAQETANAHVAQTYFEAQDVIWSHKTYVETIPTLMAVPDDLLAEGRVIFPSQTPFTMPEIGGLEENIFIARDRESSITQTWFHGDLDREDSFSSELSWEDRYRPAWAILVINQDGPGRWQVMVDAQTGAILTEREASVYLTGEIYENNSQIINNKESPTSITLPGIPEDVPGPPGRLADNPHFRVNCNGLGQNWQYQAPSANDTSAETEKKRQVANLYYHLCNAMQIFQTIAENSWRNEIIGNVVACLPGAAQPQDKQARFTLTEQSLANLKEESFEHQKFPVDVLEQLTPLRDQTFAPEEKFLQAVQNKIGEQKTLKYKQIILKHADTRITVIVQNTPRTPWYSYAIQPANRSFEFAIGKPSGLNEPMYDCEVIYHEYTHAVIAVLQPDIYGNFQFTGFDEALNEALAFYFGCTLSERTTSGSASDPSASRWGDYSYATFSDLRYDLCRQEEGKQRAKLDYFQAYNIFPEYPAYMWGLYSSIKTYGEAYACGMVWVRTLWDIRRMLGFEFADMLILRSLPLLSGVQSEFETPAEAILHCDNEYARMASSPGHEKALRLIFNSRGIMPDTPVHDLLTLHFKGKTYLLAATENSALKSGCMVSKDDGLTWTSLSDWVTPEILDCGSTTRVVALAAMECENKIVFWTANEAWIKHADSSYTLKTGVYKYELTLGTTTSDAENIVRYCGEAGSFNRDIPGNLNILSLAVVKKNRENENEFIVLAGTEHGLYQFDDNTWTCLPIRQNLKIFDLAARPRKEDDSHDTLIVATNEGVYTGNLQNLNPIAPDTGTVLTITIVEEHIWAGTVSGQIWYYSPIQLQWQLHSEIRRPARPVYALLVEKDHDGNEVLYVGTNDGVYCFYPDRHAWESFNLPTNSEEDEEEIETLKASTVIALISESGGLFASTTDRGIWRYTPDAGWSRMLLVGQQRFDQQIPPDNGIWPIRFEGNLTKAKDVRTHVLYVRDNNCGKLSFVVPEDDKENITLVLYSAAPYIDGITYKVGGLKEVKQPLEALDVKYQSFYLLTVTAKSEATDYTVEITCS